MAKDNPGESVLDLLEALRSDAEIYLAKVGAEFPDADEYGDGYSSHDTPNYWQLLPPHLRQEGKELADRLASLAGPIGLLIRRSPLLTEADTRAAGHDIKGMRAALIILSFDYQDIEILHDEGTVLGVQPPSEIERRATPPQAKSEFLRNFEDLKKRLELSDTQSSESQDGIAIPRQPTAAGIRPGTAFIMMMMTKESPELVDINNAIKSCFEKFGITAIRADDIEHEEVITDRILDAIKTSEFLIADVTGERPSVYYEIGYAHAINRRVIMYRKAGTPIHFDLAGYNCPEYENLTRLREMLMRRLEALTGGPPKS